MRSAPVDSLAHEPVASAAEIVEYLLHNVVICWIVLHRLRSAPHVHSAHRRPRFPGDLQHARIAREARYVVDDLGAGRQGLASHGRLGSVNRHGNEQFWRQFRDDWHDASSSVSTLDRFGVGPRAFAADVDHVGARGGQCEPALDARARCRRTVRRRKNCRA